MAATRGMPEPTHLSFSAAERLVALGRYSKRVIIMTSDFIVLSGTLWLSLALRWGELYVPPSWSVFAVLAVAPLISVATMFQMRLYRLVTRYISGRRALRIPAAIATSVLIWSLVLFLSGVQGIPRSVPISYAVLGALLLWLARQVAGWMLRSAGVALPERDPALLTTTVIYGAGPTGVELASALWRSGQCRPIGFIDPNPTLWGQYVGGLKVYRPERLSGMIDSEGIKEVLIAMPEAERRERLQIIKLLETLPVRVRMLPAMEDIASGRVTVNDLRPVDAGDLLGRDAIPPRPELVARNTCGKSVLVTGAGGTIGSELVRQILRQRPQRLVLLDAAEAALYEIETEVQDFLVSQSGIAGEKLPEIVAVLGSVLDAPLVRETIDANDIETIYHAAAYKHVPMVEHNAVVGLRNNTFGTAVIAEAAEMFGVERFVLVSTDKAVRPTSVMGASKRLAEMILQARATRGRGGTVFTMVRFGNVLDSSGSVVRKFRKQIEAGGPVTVTHPEIIRYFMSIPEAAGLVIQAGAMATGGEVFVLDMGEPVKIDELARSMIRLMGLQVRDEDNPDGDIAIEYVGLRPGEKLHEELLIGVNTTGTEHPRILKSHEPFLADVDLEREIAALKSAMADQDIEAIHAVLLRVVEGYRPETRHLPQEMRESGAGWPSVSRTLH